MNTAGTVVQILHHFNSSSDGDYPQNSLMQGTNGYLYGLCISGGTNYDGTVFMVDTNGADYLLLHVFSSEDCSSPYGGLAPAGDGSLWATASEGGASGFGAIFKLGGEFTPPPPAIQVFAGTNAITNGQTNAVDFGSVQQNQMGPVVTFTLTNSGSQTLDIESIAVPSGYSLGTNYPATIPAGGGGIFTVQLDSAEAGLASGNIIITNNDPHNDPFVFPISGLVTTKIISLSGDLSFGVVGIGSSKEAVLTISNAGNEALTISNISYPAGFSGNWPGGPVTNGQSQSVTVTFSPASATNYDGIVTVVSDASSGPGTIPISGFGADTNLTLTIVINGSGKVSPDLNGKVFKAGTKHTLTAVADHGNVFSNWSGSIDTNKNPLTFSMATNMILEANFVTNPFLAQRGSYNGLFFTGNGVTEQTAGMLKGLTLSQKGTYSGTLLINGASHPISGSFGLGGGATNEIKRPAGRGGPLTVMMNLITPSNSAPQVTGTVVGTNDGVEWTANLTADLATNTFASSQYTMLIEPDLDYTPREVSPCGDGYALITNYAATAKNPGAASATIKGALADGTSFSQTVPVSQNGCLPLYANIYSGKGLLLGWINLNPAVDPEATLFWVHPALHAGLFTAAFLSTNPVTLSAWTNPPERSVLAQLTNLWVSFPTNNTAMATNDFTITISNNLKVGEVSGPTPLSGSLNPKTGLLTLTMGGGASKTAGYGVVLLNATNGGGYLLTKTNAQAIHVGP
jgi:hypothetical protein